MNGGGVLVSLFLGFRGTVPVLQGWFRGIGKTKALDSGHRDHRVRGVRVACEVTSGASLPLQAARGARGKNEKR